MDIQSAIIDFQLIEIEYCSLKNDQSKRKVEPFAIYSTQGNWLMIAFCRLRQDFRIFRIDLINRLIPLNQTFEPHTMTLEQFFASCSEKYSGTPDIPLS